MLSSENSEAGNVPAFLNKLWRLVEDSGTNNFIAWSKGTNEKSFIIKDQIRFTQELLPIYFKHCNFASFVRQLNMYGFRKVPSIEAGGLFIDRGEIEFAHPKFVRGEKGLLINIKRKVQTPRISSPEKKDNDLSNVLSDIQALKVNQELVGSQMLAITKENKQLWRENTVMRQRFQKQQQIIEKLVHFLMSMVNPNVPHLGPKRKFNQLALEGSEILGSSAGSVGNLATQGTSSFEFVGQNGSKHGGPVILEVSNNKEVLEKIFEAAPPSSVPNLDVTSPVTILHVPSSKVANSQKKITVIDNISSSTKPTSRLPVSKGTKQIPLKLESFLQVYDYPETETVIIEAEPEAVNVEVSSNRENSTGTETMFVTTPSYADISSYSDLHNTVSVESLNGTVLSSGASYEEPPLSPELLYTVDPSDINPNIVVAKRNKPLIQTSVPQKGVKSSNSLSPDIDSFLNAKNCKEKSNSIKLDQARKGSGKNINNSGPNSSSIVASHPHPGKRKVNFGTGMGSNEFTFHDFEPLNNSELSSFSKTEVAIPERGEDIANYVENVDNFLDNFKMQINWGKFGNVDKSLLMSIFGNDAGSSNFVQEGDSTLPHSGHISGSEVQLYNPPVFEDLNESCSNEDIADDFTFDSLLNTNEELSSFSNKATPKKMRISIKREKHEDDPLNTPRVEVNYDTPQMFRGKM